jgi:cytochrome c oxidase subunit III
MLSDRAGKTDQVVVLPASIEDPNSPPPGLHRIGLLLTCGWIFAFFAALIVAYLWRAQTAIYWEPVQLPGILKISTGVILLSSCTFEAARQFYRKGERPIYYKLMAATTVLTLAFLAMQTSAWVALYQGGVFMMQNPHSSFFYLFTGLHAAHVAGGLVALVMVLVRKSPRREFVNSVAFYWHFLGVLWIALYATLELVP